MNRISSILAWALTVLLAFVFIMAGGSKLIGTKAMVQEFASIGFGQWLRYVTGVFEVVGALGLFVPGLRFLAALDLTCVMIGATLTNLLILHLPPTAALTAVLLVLSLLLVWLRRPQPVGDRGARFGASA